MSSRGLFQGGRGRWEGWGGGAPEQLPRAVSTTLWWQAWGMSEVQKIVKDHSSDECSEKKEYERRKENPRNGERTRVKQQRLGECSGRQVTRMTGVGWGMHAVRGDVCCRPVAASLLLKSGWSWPQEWETRRKGWRTQRKLKEAIVDVEDGPNGACLGQTTTHAGFRDLQGTDWLHSFFPPGCEQGYCWG